jgi:hypothetical protein
VPLPKSAYFAATLLLLTPLLPFRCGLLLRQQQLSEDVHVHVREGHHGADGLAWRLMRQDDIARRDVAQAEMS